MCRLGAIICPEHEGGTQLPAPFLPVLAQLPAEAGPSLGVVLLSSQFLQ